MYQTASHVAYEQHLQHTNHVPDARTNPVRAVYHHSHHQHSHAHEPDASHRPPQQPTTSRTTPDNKDTVIVEAIPSVTVSGNSVVVGNSQSTSTRSYTPLKIVGDGSFGTVWLCDWHSPLPPGTPLSPMQCGAGARPEWAGKRLVALKRMKKRWEGGWDDCKKLKELESLRIITPHPNIIPLYDYFLLPATKELYFVFESMEGNLYQLIKSRKGRPLAGGLVASIFRQVVSGLNHIHLSGYFHRDMKPENLLVTTTGLADYQPTSPLARHDSPPEKDVVVIVKLADFGLARETRSKPPYTEYVATRWYRAPEILLRSKDYSTPVDLWALGTILAELVNLKPLFPGQGEIDQVTRICEVLGDPSDEYGVDERGRLRGGGKWSRGVKMAKAVGFAFPKHPPIPFHSLFQPTVPVSLVECIADLLRYDPDARLTTQQCMEHPYVKETMHKYVHPITPQVAQPPYLSPNPKSRPPASASLPSIPPRSLPPSHSQSPSHPKLAFNDGHPPPHAHPHPVPVPVLLHDVSSTHRQPFFPQSQPQPQDAEMADHLARPGEGMLDGGVHMHLQAGASTDLLNQLRELDLPIADLASYGRRAPPSPVPSSVYSFGGDRVAANHWGRAGAPPHHASHQQQSGDWTAMAVDGPGYAASDASSDHMPMDIQRAPSTRPYGDVEHPDQAHAHQHHQHSQQHASTSGGQEQTQSPAMANGAAGHPKLGVLGSFGFKKNKSWGFFGGHGENKNQPHTLPPVDELNVASSMSTPSLKRTQSGSTTDSTSLPEMPAYQPPPISIPAMDPKKLKKEAERQEKDAERARRQLAEVRQREQARAVMMKRKQMIRQNTQGSDFDWERTYLQHVDAPSIKKSQQNKDQQSQLQLQMQSTNQHTVSQVPSVLVADTATLVEPMSGRRSPQYLNPGIRDVMHRYSDDSVEHRTKARRRETDDDHSSSDVHSVGRLSMMSFATVDSDPGPGRPQRTRGSTYDITRATSQSNLRQPELTFTSAAAAGSGSGSTYAYGYASGAPPLSAAARSSTSIEGQLVADFNLRATFDSSVSASPISSEAASSPPPMQSLSLSPSAHHQHWASSDNSSPNSPAMAPVSLQQQQKRGGLSSGNFVSLPAITSLQPRHPGLASPFDFSSHPPSPGPPSAINPIFQVPPFRPPSQQSDTPHLPPFSTFVSVVEQHQPPSPLPQHQS